MQPATHANQSTPTLSDPPMHLQRINPRTMQRTEMMSATVAAGSGKYTGRVVVDTTLMPEGEGTALWVHRDPDTRGRGHSGLTVVQYSGGWSDGARHGDGAWKTSSGASYTGKYVCEQRCGEGTAEFQAGATITGTFVDGMPHGQGVAVSGSATYTGEFVAGKWHGQGTVQYPDGSVFQGSFVSGFREGRGRFQWADGEVYDGEFSHDLRSGVGVYTWPDGRRYEGTFADDHRHGRGKLFLSDGGVFDGQYNQGQREGDGLMRYADGTVDCGEWKGNTLVRITRAPDCGGDSGDPHGMLTMAGLTYLDAVKRNDLVAIRSGLHAGTAFMDLADEEGKTAMYHATLGGFTEIMQLLLSLGARPNYLTGAGASILRDAYSILPSVVTPPLDRGPMEQFCFSKHERKVRAAITILLDSGASPNADSKQGSANPSVLLMAIRANDLSMAVNLIERGANVDFYGVDGMTLLHVALSQVKHYSDVLHMINVWRRRSKLQPAFFKVVDPHKQRFQTPHFRRKSEVRIEGCKLGMSAVAIVNKLLEAGADADAVDSTGESALHIAASIKGTLFDDTVIAKLAAVCSKPDSLASGQTALFSALKARNYRFAERLLSLDADPNMRLADGTVALCAIVTATPLSEDEAAALIRMLTLLIQAGADTLVELSLNNWDPSEKAGISNLVDYVSFVRQSQSRRCAVDGPIHGIVNPPLPANCHLTSAAIRKFQLLMMTTLLKHMREANRIRKPVVPMCYECGFRLGFGRPHFVLLRWGGAYFCSEQCKMRKQNRSRSTAVCWDPAKIQGQKKGSSTPAIMGTRFTSASPSRTRVQREGSTIRPMPLK
eukprot:m.268616 g.268616  ORF g.268616 m.268616 type:complete len:832 (+) comp26812_c0_seq2:164-2659(+)